MERVPKETEKITCPYDSCHHIMRSNLTVHMLRCRRTSKNAELVTCPFNVTHVFPRAEIKDHIAVCESRQTYEQNNQRKMNIITESNPLSESPTQQQEAISCDENWDNEPPVPAYNPQEQCENRDIIRQPVGLTPSQRVAFRNSERNRLRNMREKRQ